jgi:hypothetical protein
MAACAPGRFLRHFTVDFLANVVAMRHVEPATIAGICDAY